MSHNFQQFAAAALLIILHAAPTFGGEIKNIQIGTHYNCAQTGDEVFCVGDNGFGQSNRVTGFHELKELSIRHQHNCVLDRDGVWCWGYNEDGQVNVPVLNAPTHISTGRRHTCAVDEGEIVCWGWEFGYRGIPKDLLGIRQIESSLENNCVVHSEGVTCWGRGGVKSDTPNFQDVKDIALGQDFSCAIDGGKVICWGGQNRHGQLDVPEGIENPKLITAMRAAVCVLHDAGQSCWGQYSENFSGPIRRLNKPISLSMGHGRACAIDEEIGAVCWGGGSKQYRFPRKPKTVKKLIAGMDTICALDQDGLTCWGGLKAYAPDLRSIREIHRWDGDKHFCVDHNGGFQCWGSNYYGQMDIPVGVKDPEIIATGKRHSCILKNQEVVCWGSDEQGQVSVPKLEKPFGLAAGGYSTCAIDLKGVQCWGNIKKHPIPEMEKPKEIKVASGRACAIDGKRIKCWGPEYRPGSFYGDIPEDLVAPHSMQLSGHGCVTDQGRLRCWGESRFGEKDYLEGLDPTQPYVLGSAVSCAVIDSEVQCWGSNRNGQLNVPTRD